MANIEHRDITASADIHNPKGFAEASNSSVLVKDKDGNNAYIQLVDNRIIGNAGAGIASIEIEQSLTATKDKIPSSTAVVNAISGKLDSSSHSSLSDATVHTPKGFTAADSNSVPLKDKSGNHLYYPLITNRLLGNTGGGIGAVIIESVLSGTTGVIPTSEAVKNAIDAISGGTSDFTDISGTFIYESGVTTEGLCSQLLSLSVPTECLAVVDINAIVKIMTGSNFVDATFIKYRVILHRYDDSTVDIIYSGFKESLGSELLDIRVVNVNSDDVGLYFNCSGTTDADVITLTGKVMKILQPTGA